MVRLELASKPESATLVRALLSGLGAALVWDGELVDDLKTAVSEACNNVVMHAYGGGVGKLVVRVDSDDDWIEVVVCDEGEGLHGVTVSDDHLRVGLPVISSLAERVDFVTPQEGGTEVRMFFRSAARETPQVTGSSVRGGAKSRRGPDDRKLAAMVSSWTAQALETLVGEPVLRDGEVAGAMAPVGVFGPALGRLLRAFAAVNHFRLDRFSELRMLTDTLGAHARTSAGAERLAFALGGGERRIELVVGPFVRGSGALFAGDEPASPLRRLADEVTIQPTSGGEIVRLVVADPR
jgi:anti-sigma regulatory factor (Ser/Thr protein kinase)